LVVSEHYRSRAEDREPSVFSVPNLPPIRQPIQKSWDMLCDRRCDFVASVSADLAEALFDIGSRVDGQFRTRLRPEVHGVQAKSAYALGP
jgi:hypothetical protein